MVNRNLFSICQIIVTPLAPKKTLWTRNVNGLLEKFRIHNIMKLGNQTKENLLQN